MYRGTLIALVATIASPLITFASEVPLAPDAAFTGRPIATLANEWWQWAMSIPDATNPLRDQNGEHCARGQGGKVWFLAGGFGSSKIRRTCTIPPGKPLFFPLVNMAYWPRSSASQFTCEQAKLSAALNNDTAIELFAELDGTSIEGLKQYRVASQTCFDMFARIPRNVRPYKAYPAASDGYWLLLKPLKKGHHSLKFGGRYNRKSGAFGRMVQDIEYELIVQ